MEKVINLIYLPNIFTNKKIMIENLILLEFQFKINRT